MLGNNDQVRKFIDYYSKLTISPEYAVLIKGSWGCGKSYLVQQCMDELKISENPIKFLYVSLYGIASVEDIEAKFFQLLNPVLTSKGMVLAGRFAKGLLKGALKIDMDDDGKPDGTITIGKPDINLADYMTDTRDYVLVFDDLERCSMELKSILGYINYFVEKDGYKVILIADEEKLIGSAVDVNDASRYESIKEKLIGKTLAVEADVSSVFDIFLEGIIGDDDLRKLLENNKGHIIFNFDKSTYGNLRSLRMAFLEFDRLWRVLCDEVKVKSELASHLLKLFFVLSAEVYSGAISPSELKRLIGTGAISREIKHSNGQEKELDKYASIESKYNVSFYDAIISVEEWETLFGSGSIDPDQINSSLKMSRYFSEENTPDWIKLWNIYKLEDDEFNELYQSVRASLDNLEYVEPGVIKHISGLLLNFSRLGLITQTIEESLADVKDYIDTVFSSDNVNVDETSLEQINHRGFYVGLGYLDVDSAEFKQVSEYLNKKVIDAQSVELADRVEEVLDIIRSNPKQLYTLLCHSNYERSPFCSRPILQYIPPQDFMTLMLEISNDSKQTVSDVLSYRYKTQGLNAPLLPELSWLVEVAFILDSIIDSSDDVKPSTITFNYMKTNLDQALAYLRASQRVEPASE